MKTTALPNDMAAFNSYYYQLKRNAKSRNIPFQLNKDFVYRMNKQKCYYCGRLPEQVYKSNHSTDNYFYNGIDRVDNNKSVGYMQTNTIPCCGDCNNGRGNRYTVEEYKIMINALMEYRGDNIYEYDPDFIEVPIFKIQFKWTEEDIIIESLKYSTRIEWKTKSPSSYRRAWKLGKEFFESCNPQMTKRFIWTKELILQEVKKYKSKKEWRNESPNSQQSARRKGKDFFTLCCVHFD